MATLIYIYLFFQIGYEHLTVNGVLGLITVNTFIKSVNGRALRNYFAENKIELKIINFGGEQIFKDRNTYTCLCFLQKKQGSILYKRISSSSLLKLNQSDFFRYSYNELNNHDGWNLVDSLLKNELISKIEATGRPFKDLFTTRNGIATLKNDIFKFTPIKEDATFYYLSSKSGKEYKIEKGICRRIVNANKIKSVKELIEKEEKIIFPYIQEDKLITILPEKIFAKKYPLAYKYLADHKKILSKRDKGARQYEEWYAYGRRQSLDIHSYKLFFPHICERPTFVISKDKELLFYNGIAVVSNDLNKLWELKSLLESDIFFEYIKNTTKDYSSGYISMSKNYIKNFGIPEISKEDRIKLKSSVVDSNLFWKKIYCREHKSSDNGNGIIHNSQNVFY